MRKPLLTILVLAIFSCGGDEYSYYIKVDNESNTSVLFEFPNTTVNTGQAPVDTLHIGSGIEEYITIQQNTPNQIDEFSPDDILGDTVYVTFQDSIRIEHSLDNINSLEKHLFNTTNYTKEVETTEKLYSRSNHILTYYIFEFTEEDFKNAQNSN